MTRQCSAKSACVRSEDGRLRSPLRPLHFSLSTPAHGRGRRAFRRRAELHLTQPRPMFALSGLELAAAERAAERQLSSSEMHMAAADAALQAEQLARSDRLLALLDGGAFSRSVRASSLPARV